MGYLQVIVQAIRELGSDYDTVANGMDPCKCGKSRVIVGVRDRSEKNIEVLCTNQDCDHFCSETWITYDF